MPGNTGALLSTVGGVQLESIGLVLLVGDELGGGEVSVLGSRQPLLSERAKIRIAEIARYFIFALFITAFIIARRQNWGKDKGLGMTLAPFLAIYAVGTLGS